MTNAFILPTAPGVARSGRSGISAVSETRKLAAILVADVVGYTRLAGADEDRILARLRALRSDLIDPTIAIYRGRVVKRTGDGVIVEFRSVVDAVNCAIEFQGAMVERNAGVTPDKRIEFRIGIHLGDVVEEADGDLMGDGINIAVRVEGICKPGGVCLSGAAYEQVRDRVKEAFVDLGEKQLKHIARPIRAYDLALNRNARASAFTFGSFRLFPDQQLLLDGETPVRLGSRARELLTALVERPTVVVTKDELLARVWPKQFVEESNLKFHVAALRKALGDGQRGNRFITNVPGRGYCFVAPVESLDRKLPSPTRAKPDAPAEDTSERVDSLEVEFPAEAGSPSLESPPEKSAPSRLSLVVLPFANIGGNPEQEHFVDGVTESLTTDLSRMRGAYVVARNTAFTYKGKSFDVKTIGRELNVRYILEGSVQRAGARIRVNVQLIDAESGNHLWAERFDKPVADLFDMQDEIVARLATALKAQLVAAEARRLAQAPNPDSMDLYFQGMAWFYKGLTPDNVAQARGFFDRAVAADPSNVDALIWSARADVVAGTLLFVTDRVTALGAAEAKLTKALSLVPDHALGHMILGYLEMLTKRGAEGIAECEHALALDRNLAHAHAMIGYGKVLIGRAEEAEAHVVEAQRLGPRDTTAYLWMNIVGIANGHLGRWEQAVAWFRRSIEANRNYPHAMFRLSGALAQLGRLKQARSAVKAGLGLNPTFTISHARTAWTAMSDDPTYLAQLEPLLDGMRKAGVPE
jgi:TolB-like protein/class 3 adenylate cyclase/DNA-binding winged helix-turn-helix (wHTH) protein